MIILKLQINKLDNKNNNCLIKIHFFLKVEEEEEMVKFSVSSVANWDMLYQPTSTNLTKTICLILLILKDLDK